MGTSGIPPKIIYRSVKSYNIYIYIVLFGPVKPESGVNPSGQKTFNSKHVNFPGKEYIYIYII